MNALSNDVRLNAQGEHIAHFHDLLRKLGYNIDTAELGMQLFGASTRQRVIEFQTKSYLPPTGIVDGRTVDAIRLAANKGEDMENTPTGVGKKQEVVRPNSSPDGSPHELPASDRPLHEWPRVKDPWTPEG
jgi:peptidoglycan hydrolase-like protein with peptidoglycan-binding domain